MNPKSFKKSNDEDVHRVITTLAYHDDHHAIYSTPRWTVTTHLWFCGSVGLGMAMCLQQVAGTLWMKISSWTKGHVARVLISLTAL